MNSGSALSGFTGFIANGAGLNINGATVNFSSYSPFQINTSFSLSSGTFTAPSSTMNVSDDFTISGGTFNANGGTLIFNGGGDTISCNSVTFNLIVFSNTENKTISGNCTLPLGTDPTIPHNLTLNGTLTGSGILTTTTGTLSIGGSGALSGFTGLVANGALSSAATTLNFGSYSPVDLNNNFTLTAGTFTAPGLPLTMTLAGNLSISGSPTFNANGGTVIFDGGAASLICSSVNFNSVVFNNTGLKTINNDCNFPLGNNPTLGVSTSGSITSSGNLIGTGTITFSGNYSHSTNAVLTGFNKVIAYSTSITNSLDLSTYTSADITTSFTLNSGTFTAPPVMNIGINFVNNLSGTFIANNGTVNFVDCGSFIAQYAINGSTTFYNLTATTTQACTVVFEKNQTQTITHNLTLTGVSGGILSLNSSSIPLQWNIDPQGTRNITYANVTNSHNVNANTILAGDANNTDLGNNLGWDFNNTPTISSLGPTNLTDGSTTTDSTPTFSFTTGDPDTSNTVQYHIQIDNNTDFSSPVIDFASDLISQGAKTYTVGQGGGTYSTGNLNMTLSNGSYYLRIQSIDNFGKVSNYITANAGNIAFKINVPVVTVTPTPTDTPTPTETPTPELTETPLPTEEPTNTPSPIIIATTSAPTVTPSKILPIPTLAPPPTTKSIFSPEFLGETLTEIVKESGPIGTVSIVTQAAGLALGSIQFFAMLQYLIAQGFLIPFFLGIFKPGRRGKVVDDFSKEGIMLVLIRTIDKETGKIASKSVSSLNGKFRLILKPGNYIIEFFRKDYQKHETLITVTEKVNIEKEVGLHKIEEKDFAAQLQYKVWRISPNKIILLFSFILAAINIIFIHTTISYIIFGVSITSVVISLLREVMQKPIN
jgi:hypothetical protein